MISTDLIQRRLKHFWGYGSPQARTWLVGMDERFDMKKEGMEMLERQLAYADANARNGMLDASRSKLHAWAHLANMAPFTPRGTLQTTWKYPIALLLYLHTGQRPSADEILKYQREVLADSEKRGAATLELSPLPCPSTRKEDWIYGGFDVPGLSTRREYEKEYLPARTEKLGALVQMWKPKLVIFYSKKYLPYWREVIGTNPQPVTRRTLFARDEHAAYCIIPNGGQSGLGYRELYEFAEIVRSATHP